MHFVLSYFHTQECTPVNLQTIQQNREQDTVQSHQWVKTTRSLAVFWFFYILNFLPNIYLNNA